MSDLLRVSRSPWYATPVVAVAVLLGFNGISSMVEWGSWFTAAMGLIALTTVAIAITRMVSRSRLLPTLVGFIVAVLASIPVFARGPEGQVRYLPTPTALRELVDTVAEGVHDAATSVPPAEMTRPLVALVMCGAFAVFLLAEHLAVSWRAAAVSGIVLLVPWMPAIALQHRLSVRMLLAAIGCWVILLALTKRPTGVASRPSPLATMTAAVATITLVAVVTPTALGGNGWGLIPRLTTPDQLETTSRLNLELDLRNSLTANSSSAIMVYVSTGERPEVFRLYTLADFDGAKWSLDESEGSKEPSDGVLWSNPVSDWESHPLDLVAVSVQDFVADHLPLPTVPRTVDAPGSWEYSPSHDVVTSSVDTTRWLDYTFEADLTYFEAEGLRSLGAASGDDARLGRDYVAIPDEADRERFTALATEITAGATTRYDQAVALQEYFRDTDNFTYDTAVDPAGDDSVSVFLDSRTGYCVQFASGMVMLARSIGIPSRLAIGFLPGAPSGDGSSVVRGGDAHAWPEIYLEGAGWVRFEPTPSVQTGARPVYANPAGEAQPVDDVEVPVTEPETTGAPRPDTDDGSTPVPQAPESEESVPWALYVMVALAVALALGATAWWLRRRRAEEERVPTPETVWATLGDRLPPELTWHASLTPHESVDHVTTTLAAEGALLTDDAADAFMLLSDAVADFRYAPEGTIADVAALSSIADEVVAAVAEARGLDSRGRPIRAGARDGSRRGA